MPALIVVAVIVVLLIIFVIGVYNSLIRLRNQVDNSWSQIDVQLKRRHDLIPILSRPPKAI
jgi:LemA protein